MRIPLQHHEGTYKWKQERRAKRHKWKDEISSRTDEQSSKITFRLLKARPKLASEIKC